MLNESSWIFCFPSSAGHLNLYQCFLHGTELKEQLFYAGEGSEAVEKNSMS